MEDVLFNVFYQARKYVNAEGTIFLFMEYKVGTLYDSCIGIMHRNQDVPKEKSETWTNIEPF